MCGGPVGSEKIFVMVKYLSAFLFLCCLSSCFRYIPRHYFVNYENAMVESSSAPRGIPMGSTYVWVDSVEHYLSQKFGQRTHSCSIIFFYSDFQYASIYLPRKLPNGQWLLSIADYENAMNAGQIDHTEEFNWAFYRIENGHLVTYGLDYKSVEWNVFNKGFVVNGHFIVTDSCLISDARRKKSMKYTGDIIFNKRSVIRPDSSRSALFCRWKNKYKYYRRLYARNNPDYFNPCKCELTERR
jgi:hypothetical protein